MTTYYVAGIIQITVKAENATDAVKKALARQETLMKNSPTLNMNLENIATTDIASVRLDDAWMLDDEMKAQETLHNIIGGGE